MRASKIYTDAVLNTQTVPILFFHPPKPENQGCAFAQTPFSEPTSGRYGSLARLQEIGGIKRYLDKLGTRRGASS